MERLGGLDLEMLNPEQREAVTVVDGPLLVLAGAGTGKTRVLISRIAHLIEAHDVAPGQILAITFTRKAALEMKERLAAILGDGDTEGGPFLSTFHALGSNMLREHGSLVGLASKFGVADDLDTLYRTRKILKDQDLPPNAPGESRSEVQDRIARAKLALVDRAARGIVEYGGKQPSLLEQYQNGALALWEPIERHLDAPSLERFQGQYECYQSSLASDEVVDYSDLICLPLIMLLEQPGVLSAYQDRWRYILVDEYQDTDFAQDHLLRLLAGARQNLCVVGDDDQAIYSWRGAKVENIRTFPKRYDECRVVPLEENYRSTPLILEAANAVLASRPEVERHDKTLWTRREGGLPIHVWTAMSQEAEALGVAQDIRRAYEDGEITTLDEVLVLYRMNALGGPLEEAFRRLRVPYRLIGGTPLHERRDVGDMLAYLKIANNPYDTVSFERAARAPSRGVGPATVESVRSYARTFDLDMLEAAERAERISHLRAPQVVGLSDFVALVRDLQHVARRDGAAAALHHVIEKTGIRGGLIERLATMEQEDDDEEAERVLRRLFDLDDFVLYVEEFSRRSVRENAVSLTQLLDDLATISPGDRLHPQESHEPPAADVPPGAVSLMTVHASKGLESRHVYVVGLEEEVFPLGGDSDANVSGEPFDFRDEQMAEEARLYYVALTRAQDRLVLSAARTRELRRSDPRPMMRSRFLAALPETIYVHFDKR